MNLKEFREKTAHLPETMELFMGERMTTFAYGLVNGATVKSIPFLEDEGDVADEDTPREEVLILTED